MTSIRLFDLIMQGQKLVDAIASHPEYRLLKDNEDLSDLDVQLSDCETFLWQLNAAREQVEQACESQAGSGSLPSFEQLFDEDSLSNSLLPLKPVITEVKGLHS